MSASTADNRDRLDDLEQRVREIFDWLNRDNWICAPVVTPARMAVYHALRFEDSPRGRPSVRLLQAAIAAYEALPTRVRERVESRRGAGPFVPDHVRQQYLDSIGLDVAAELDDPGEEGA